MIHPIAAARRHLHKHHPSPSPSSVHDRLDGLAPPLVKGLQKAYGFLFGPTASPPEPPAMHGEAYLLRPSGETQVVRSGEESDPNGNDAPQEAVVSNRIVIAVEGINNAVSGASATLAQMFEHDGASTVNLGQPMMVVHEGIAKDREAAMARIGEDVAHLKEVERGHHVDKKAFKTDPAVETCYDLVKQQLDQGRDVLMVPHSGGGAESALALNLLAHDGYQQAIGEHVRVMSFAGMASPEDYALAGVKPDNVLFVGDHLDAIAVTGSQFIDPHHVVAGGKELEKRLKQPGMDFSLGQVHSIPNIMSKTHDHVQAFLEGGPGGTYLG